MYDKPERICYHVPIDLIPKIREIASQEQTPPSKWLSEIIRKEIRRQRQINLMDLNELEAFRGE